MHVLAAQGSEQEEGMHKFYTETCLASGIVMEIHCHITGVCEPPMSSSLFSVIYSWFSQSIVPVHYHNKFPKLYAMWLIYVPPKVKLYKNHLEFHCNDLALNMEGK